MNVKELNRAQLLQLKANYYEEKHPEGVSYGELAEIDSLVSDEEVIDAYDGVDFVEDDFLGDGNAEDLNFIKVMLPPDEESYKHGAGEGCFFIVDDRTKTAYDLNATGGDFYGILDNDSYYYPGLKHGERLPIEMRGSRAPVVPITALKKWKARPVEEVLAEYAEYMKNKKGDTEQ